MTISKYFWDLNDQALRETKRVLQDPQDPQFSQRMATLLSRCDKPKELFRIVPKEKFVEAWPKIRSFWMKKTRRSDHRDWWETLYEQMTESAGKKSTANKGNSSVVFKKFGDKIKEKRIERGLSQKQLAHQTSLKQPVISQIEDGKVNLTLFTLVRVCKVLGIGTIDIE